MRKVVVKNSLADQAYELIIEKIQNRELLPGDRINIEELAKEFEVSRTPLREAISRLAQNGFLESKHNVGPSVATYDAKKATDLIEANTILIEGAMRVIFKEGISEEWIYKLQQVVDNQKNAYKKGDVRAFFKNSIYFHEVLIMGCPNLKLRQLTLETQTQLAVWVYRYQETSEAKNLSIDDHQGMVNYLKENEQNRFFDLLKTHNERPLEYFKNIE
ncbi:GntR family transcriptional regulator [Bacillota bacterium]